MRGFGGGVRSAPVGEDEAFEVEVFLEDVVEQVVVFAGKVAVDAVVGAHDGAGVGDARGRSRRRSRSVSRMERLSMLALTALRPLS